MMPTHISIINDCLDANARLRIESQVRQLFPAAHVAFYGVPIFATLSLSFLIAEGEWGPNDLILFNAAPRGEKDVSMTNASGELVFLRLQSGALAVGPDEGYALSLFAGEIVELYTDVADRSNTKGTQFRSAYVFPHLAHEFIERDGSGFAKRIINEWPIRRFEERRIVWIDSFGNLKLSATDALAEREYHVRFLRSGTLLAETTMPYRGRLTNVEQDELALITGSSFGERGLEIVFRATDPGVETSTRILTERFGYTPLPEDEVVIV